MFTLIIGLIFIGVVMWAVNKYIPMQPTIKTILNVTVVILVILWLFNIFIGFEHLGNLNDLRIGK